ncbi:MAG: DUF3177 family protein [Cyanobacteria bacterium P01_D01_bin.105]
MYNSAFALDSALAFIPTLTNPASVRSLVWTDYRLALLFAVFIPLTILIWSWVQKSEAISLLMTIYWRVASLLAITVYLMIGGWGFSFITSLLAKVLIPISVWFWADLNEEIREQPKKSLHLAFNVWRWAISIYCVSGAFFQLFFIPCAFGAAALSGDTCQAWRQPSLVFKDVMHSGFTNGFLGFWGIVGLVIYALYLGYFLVVRLGRQGRTALNQ